MAKPLSPSENSLTMFRHFIAFLEIYGQENYGESAEVNWHEVHLFCNKYHLLDFNDELSEVIYTEDEEDFRDKCFTFIENKILNGYPVWRLFKMSQWLKEKLEQSFQDEIIREKEKFYRETRCYRCKNIHIETTIIEPINKNPISYDKDNPVHLEWIDKRKVPYIFRFNCKKRSELIIEKSNGCIREMRRVKLDYCGFNTNDNRGEWKMNIWGLRKCPYFEEDESMTFVKRIQENLDIVIDK